MKICLVKKNHKLIPYDNQDLELLNKLKDGIVYGVPIKKARNYKFHKKFFALLNIGYDNTKLENISFDAYRAYIIMKSGYYEVIKTPKGETTVPKSIKFDKMDDTEFTKLYNSAISVVAIDIQADQQIIEQELLNFI